MKRFNQHERPDKFKRPHHISVERSSEESDAQQKKGKGGQHQYIYGNYNNFYTVRRRQGDAVIDSRVDLIDESRFTNKRILDIGCNTGNISIAIASKYIVASVHGVDIDEKLILKANTNLKLAYSLSDPHKDPTNSTIDLSLRSNYFPSSMTYMFGFMPISIPPSKQKDFTGQFPFNVSFATDDWTKSKASKHEQYDTILALGMTKWIQLHGGDKGLKSFFKKAYDSLAEGGAFILEFQDFSTFKKNGKQLDPPVDVEEELKFRPEDYTDFLVNALGFKEHHDMGIPKNEKKGSPSTIHMYVK